MRILVVEDERKVAADLARALEGGGHVVEQASDGEKAWFLGDTEDYDLVVLDELTYTMKFDWIPVEDVLAALRSRHERTHVIITGRDAPPELVEFADLVTEMREVKHPYKVGIKAQPGIEF